MGADNKLLESSFISVNFDFYNILTWTTAHDVLLCKEILVQKFYKFKKGSNESGRIWTQISENLNSVTTIKFKLNQRVVRERFDLLLGRCRQQSKEEAKASSASPEPTELDRRIVRRNF